MTPMVRLRASYPDCGEVHQKQGSYTRPFRRPPRIVIVFGGPHSGSYATREEAGEKVRPLKPK